MPRANKTGSILEAFVEGILEDARYEKVHSSLFFAMREMQQPIYAPQCDLGRDLYGKVRRVDFILYHPTKWPDCLVIQCKWQASSGSVEEKYPFEVLSTNLNPYPTIILLDGGGYSAGAAQWLRLQAGQNSLRHVYSQGDFQRFVARGLL